MQRGGGGLVGEHIHYKHPDNAEPLILNKNNLAERPEAILCTCFFLIFTREPCMAEDPSFGSKKCRSYSRRATP